MRLIDADSFKRFLQALCKAGAPYEEVIQLLDKEPTAYDIEKVVKDIEEEKFTTEEKLKNTKRAQVHMCTHNVALNKAIAKVRAETVCNILHSSTVKSKDKNIKTIADHYGYENQSRQLIEEMAELMVAINKYDRVDKANVTTAREQLNIEYLLENIFEEIADVEVMLAQIKYILRCQDKVEQVKQYKIKRQLERIGE